MAAPRLPDSCNPARPPSATLVAHGGWMFMSRFFSRTRALHALSLALVVYAVLWLAMAAGLLRQATLHGFDWYNGWLVDAQPSTRTVVVGFQESDFKYAGTYPYPDDLLARLLERVLADQPHAIVLNLLRDVPVEPGHERLLAAYRRAPMLFGIDVVRPGEPGEVGAMAPPVLREAGRYGFANSLNDVDGVVRTMLLSDVSREPLHQHVVAKVAQYALARQGVTLTFEADGAMRIGDRRYPPLVAGRDVQSAAEWTDSWAAHLIPQRHRAAPPEVSFADVLEGRVAAGFFRGQSVVIGTTASSMARLVHLPLAPVGSKSITSPVWFAHSLDNLYAVALDGWPVIRPLPLWLEQAGLLVFAWLVCLSLLHVSSLIGWAVRSGLWALVLVAGGLLAFWNGWWLPVVPGLAALLLALVLVVNNIVRSEARQRELHGAFRQVFDQLPDPVYVLDAQQQFVMINRAFGELALRTPDTLLKQPAATVLGPWTARSDATGERHLQRPGQPQLLRVHESRMPGNAGGAWTIGIVQSSRTPVIAEPVAADIDSDPQSRFAAAAYWTRDQQTPLALAWLQLLEVDLLESAYGADQLPAIEAAILSRLHRAFPDAVLCDGPQPRQFRLLLPRRVSSAAALRQLLAQAFSWPLDLGTRMPAVEIDLSAGHAFFGPDGDTLAALTTAARARLQPLQTDLPA